MVPIFKMEGAHMRRGEREMWVHTEGKTAVSKLLYPGEAAALLGRGDKLSRSEEETEACFMLVFISFVGVYFSDCGQVPDK